MWIPAPKRKALLRVDLSAKEKSPHLSLLPVPFLYGSLTFHGMLSFLLGYVRGYMESEYMWLTLETLSKMQPASRIRESGLCLSLKSPISNVWFPQRMRGDPFLFWCVQCLESVWCVLADVWAFFQHGRVYFFNGMYWFFNGVCWDVICLFGPGQPYHRD